MNVADQELGVERGSRYPDDELESRPRLHFQSSGDAGCGLTGDRESPSWQYRIGFRREVVSSKIVKLFPGVEELEAEEELAKTRSPLRRQQLTCSKVWEKPVRQGGIESMRLRDRPVRVHQEEQPATL